ncbi:hypothetical protein [Polaromonas sp. CG9_12]|nr:hypothetical protein [Polaromonas sp. CG9_12]
MAITGLRLVANDNKSTLDPPWHWAYTAKENRQEPVRELSFQQETHHEIDRSQRPHGQSRPGAHRMHPGAAHACRPCAGRDITDLQPHTIGRGSGGATCTTTLSAVAPAGGTAVALTSSLTKLATPVPSVTVPAGQTAANFTVATNARYRRYSGLAFAATITASANGTSRSAPLSVTAQARPNDVVLNPEPSFSGLKCAGDPGLLFDCQKGPNSACSFKQECTLGCLGRPQEGTSWKDVCAAAGPFPISLNPKSVVGGKPSAGTLLLSAPAPAGSFALAASSSLIAATDNRLNMPIPAGATSLGFSVLTAPVNAIQFANMDAHLTTPEARPEGGTFFASRHQRTWLVVTPGTRPPVNLTSLALDIPSLRGGLFTGATACIDQLKPAPEVGDVSVAITSSQPTVATILTPSFSQGSNCALFGVQTAAVAVDTLVTITATLGAQSLTALLTVKATPSATFINSFFLDPLSVVGANTSTGTVVLNGLAPAGGAVVPLASANTAVVDLPASVTDPAGSDRLSFAVATNGVAVSTSITLTAAYGVSTFTSLSVLPGGGPTVTLSSHTLSPASVANGGASTGTVTLRGVVPANSAGVVVTLSSPLSSLASVPSSVSVPAGASSASYTAIAGTVSATSSSATIANFTVSTSTVAAATVASVSATYDGVSRTTTLTVNSPASGAEPAPTLLSSFDDARFSPGASITFDWSDAAGAASYTIAFDDSSTIAAPLIATQTPIVSQTTISSLPARRMWWRVRANSANGSAGAWSVVRRFEIK